MREYNSLFYLLKNPCVLQEKNTGMQQLQPGVVQNQFFSSRNEVSLIGTLQQQCPQGLTEKQQVRLTKSLKHYMTEVWDTNGPMPLSQLNREVLNATGADFQTYLRRDKAPTVNLQEYPDQRPSVAQIQHQAPLRLTQGQRPEFQGQAQQVQRPEFQGQGQGQGQVQRVRHEQVPYQPRMNPTFSSEISMDTGTRFERLQQDRQPAMPPRPPVPDFKLTMEDTTTSTAALTLFEQAKKQREEEAARVKAIAPASSTPSPVTDNNPLIRYTTPTTLNDANANSTLALPTVLANRPPLPQDILIRQDDILTYKETEYNLFLYSADRDWLNNTKENRYNFSVNFDTGNNQQGFNYSPSATKKFKNIVRIELVKVVLPTEGLTNIVQYTGSAFNTLPKVNVLSYPYIMLHITELDNNNFGTDNHLDNAFGVLQYDANWYTDTSNLTDGFLAMIPKFLKCQKVYQPTPLATLNKLSIQLQNPTGANISDTADTLSIQSVFIGGTVSASVYTGNYNTSDYVILQTSTFFSQWAFTEGNTLQIQGLVASQINSYSTVSTAATDLVAWLQLSAGQVIVGVGNSTNHTDGPNAVGYCNLIILRNRFVDPTTGSTTLNYFGRAANNTALATALYNSSGPSTTTFTGAKLINLTHQTHLVFRIITREMDPTARVRPDNL